MPLCPIATILLVITDGIITNGLSEQNYYLNDLTTPDNRNVQHIPCILNLTANYFHTNDSLRGSLVIINFIPDGTQFQRRILTSFNEEEAHKFSVMVKDAMKPHKTSYVRTKAKNYFMIIETVDEISIILKQLKLLPTWNPNAFTFLLLSRPERMHNRADGIQRAFEILLNDSIINANIMYPIEDTNVTEVVSWFPYDGDNCADSVKNIRVIHQCEAILEGDADEFIVGTKLTTLYKNYNIKFPRNLKRCPLRISVAKWPPYTVYNDVRGEYTLGIEIEMLKTVTDLMNMSPIFLRNSRPRANAINLTEYYSQILQSQVDIMMGGMDENNFTRKYLFSSIPYFQDDVTWCVSKSGLAPKWSNIFDIFTPTTWVISLTSIIISAIILYFLNKAAGTRPNTGLCWEFLIILGVTIENVGQYRPKRNYVRIFFITVVLYGINFSTAYKSYLISVLTNPRYTAQVSSTTEVLTSDFKLAGGVNIMRFYDKNDDISKLVSARFERCQNIDQCLKRLKNESNLAIGVSRTHAININLDKRPIYCFSRSNNIYTFSVTMLMKRNYHLRNQINEIVRNILQSGLIDKWEDDAKLPKKLMAKTDDVREFIVLSLNHVQGAFYCWTVGIIIATINFVGELIWFRYSKKLVVKGVHKLP